MKVFTVDPEGVVLLESHTHHRNAGISRGGRNDDALGSTLQVSLSLLASEDTSGLYNVFGPSINPFDVRGISLLEDGVGFSFTTRFLFSALTVPWNLPWVASCWNM